MTRLEAKKQTNRSRENSRSLMERRDGVSGSNAHQELMSLTALNQKRALTKRLMEVICERDNLNKAFKRVKSNKGAAGIDGMEVEVLLTFLKTYGRQLISSLLDGSYRPSPVKGVKIPNASIMFRCKGVVSVKVLRLLPEYVILVSVSISSITSRAVRYLSLSLA